MQITTFGVIWILILIIASIKGSKALIKCVLFSAIMQSGLVLVIGRFAITPLEFSCMFYIVYYLLTTSSIKIFIPLSIKFGLLYWIIVLVSSTISAVAFRGIVFMEPSTQLTFTRYNGELHLRQLIFLLIYILAGLLMYNDKPLGRKDVHHFLTVCVWFFAVVGIWQVLTIQMILPRNKLFEQLIYSNTISKEVTFYYLEIERISSNFRLYSCFQEPSYTAGFLALTFYYFISQDRLSFADKITVSTILVMMVLTFSATTYPSVFIAGILALVTTNRIKLSTKILRRGLLIIAAALVVLSLTGLWDQINKWIFQKGMSGSAFIREAWNRSALQTFKETMFLGLGYASVRDSSLLFTLPSSVGLLGTMFYVLFILSIVWYTKQHDTDKKYSMMVISVTISQLIAIGLTHYSILWLSVLLYCTARNSTNESKIKLMAAG